MELRLAAKLLLQRTKLNTPESGSSSDDYGDGNDSPNDPEQVKLSSPFRPREKTAHISSCVVPTTFRSADASKLRKDTTNGLRVALTPSQTRSNVSDIREDGDSHSGGDACGEGSGKSRHSRGNGPPSFLRIIPCAMRVNRFREKMSARRKQRKKRSSEVGTETEEGEGGNAARPQP